MTRRSFGEHDAAHMPRRRNWCWCLGLLGLIGLCFGAYKWLDWYVNTPHSARPLFHKWRPERVGRGYVLNRMVVDAQGAHLLYDDIISMLALFPVGDSQHPGGIVFRGYPDTEISIRPFFGRVSAMPNTLLIQYPGTDAAYFGLQAGAAATIAEKALHDEPSDLVAYLVEHYAGSEADRLREYLMVRGHEGP